MSKTKALKGTTMALALSGILAFSTAPSYADLGDQVLKLGMEHKDIQVLQQELKNLGLFNNEETTSYYGKFTEQGVRAFQIYQGIEINGIFDTTTYQALKVLKSNSNTPVVKTETAKVASAPVSATNSALKFERELSLEIQGEDVRLLQEALKALQYLDIDTCTDYFGSMTEEALKAFQQSQGLNADGIAGLRTIEAFNQVLTGRGITISAANRSSELGTLSSKIVATAKSFLGSRYVYGGSSPSGFDCSGFTSYVYKQHGISVSRSSIGQSTDGTKVSKENLQPGDLLIFSNTYKSGVSHTGLYLGNGKFIHASTSTTGVIISDLNSGYYTGKFSYGRRVF